LLARCALPERGPDGNLLAVETSTGGEESSERLVRSGRVLVERIVSTGQSTPPREWLEQDRDEWVALLTGEAELSFADGSRLRLRAGDHVLIQRGELHRVEWTRSDPPCVWLAVHAEDLERSP
jgi:cupin 2 domain-containing protein